MKKTTTNEEKDLHKRELIETVLIGIVIIACFSLLFSMAYSWYSHRKTANYRDSSEYCLGIAGDRTYGNRRRSLISRIDYEYNGNNYSVKVKLGWNLYLKKGDYLLMKIDPLNPTKWSVVMDNNIPIIIHTIPDTVFRSSASSVAKHHKDDSLLIKQ